MSRVALSFWLIVAAALFLRLITINQHGFWFDEVLTLKISPLDWPAQLVLIERDESSKPPFYDLFMHQWLRGGDSETWARLPSAIFGSLTCGFYFLIALRLTGRTVAWLAAIYLILSPFHLDYSQEARMYAVHGLACALAFFYLLRFFDHQKIYDLLVFGLFTVLVEYTFSYGFFFIGLAALLALARWRELGFRKIFLFLATTVFAFLVFVPWLLEMVHVSADPQQAYKGSPWFAVGYTLYVLGYGFDLGPSTTDLQLMRSSYFHTHPAQDFIVVVTLGILLVLLVQGIRALRKNYFLLVFSLGGLFVFLVFPAIIALLRPTITYNPRYAFLSLFPFGLLLATGVDASWRAGWPSRVPVLLFGLALSAALGNFYFNPAYGREDLRGAVRYIETLHPSPQAVVVCSGHLALVVDHYYHGPGSVIDFGTSGDDFAEQTQKLTGNLQGVDRFAVIYARPDHGDPRHQFFPWLKDHYHLIDEKLLPGAETAVFESEK